MIALLLTLLLQDDPVKLTDDLAAKSVKPDGPGAAVLVMKDGKVLHKKGYGLANLEHKAPVTADSVFDLASLSKQFTAMAVMLLADRGTLAFEDDARKLLPELPEHDKARPIRIVDLLHQVSGLPDYLNLLDQWKGDPDRMKNDDVLKLVAAQKLAFPTGTKWAYSNSNYCLLALVVERASKKTFAQFLRAEIFEPLGMKSSLVLDDATIVIPNRAYGYGREKGRWAHHHSDLVMTGDGAVQTSIEDWTRWEGELREPKLVKPETLQRAFAPGALDGGKAHSYGFGWSVGTVNERRVIEHSGGWVGYTCHVARYPDDGLAVVVLTNCDRGLDPTRMARQIAKAWLAKKEY